MRTVERITKGSVIAVWFGGFVLLVPLSVPRVKSRLNSFMAASNKLPRCVLGKRRYLRYMLIRVSWKMSFRLEFGWIAGWVRYVRSSWLKMPNNMKSVRVFKNWQRGCDGFRYFIVDFASLNWNGFAFVCTHIAQIFSSCMLSFCLARVYFGKHFLFSVV